MITPRANLQQNLDKPLQLEINPTSQLLQIESLNSIQKISKSTENMINTLTVIIMTNKEEQEFVPLSVLKKLIMLIKANTFN